MLSLTGTEHFLVNASRGDMSYEYRSCWYECVNRNCFDHDATSQSRQEHQEHQEHQSEVVKEGREEESFILLRFLEWTCEDNCHYDCMQNHALSRSRKGLPTWQYHGHWPFIRLWGVEEPASAIFSIANALPHLNQLLMVSIPSLRDRCSGSGNMNSVNIYKRSIESNSRNDYVMSLWIDIFPFVGLTAWVTSTLFHIKKNRYTIPMDYVSALGLLTYYLWMTLRRVSIDLLGLPLSSSSSLPVSSSLLNFIFICFISLWIWQSHRIILGQVRFESHLQICIVLAGLQFALWLVWAYYIRSSHSRRTVILQLYFVCVALLELFDFPPLFNHFDAHSLWHAATVPLGFWWFYFWNDDIHLYLNDERDKTSDTKVKKSK